MATRKYLSIYLNDHLAFLVTLRAVAHRSRRANRGSDLGGRLDEVVTELEASRKVLEEVFEELGVRRDPLKRTAAWVAEKAGRLKLNGHLFRYSPLSRVLELEVLMAGAVVEARTWEALASIARRDFPREIEACERRRRDLARFHGEAVALALGEDTTSRTR